MMPAAISLRRAARSDWPHVESLLKAARLPLAGAQDHCDDFLVAISDAIVGCVGLERYGTAGLLRSLAVTPAQRGAGVGQALVNACIDHARVSGVHTLVLLTETAESFFGRLGFVRIDRTDAPAAVRASREFRDACPASAVTMTRDLRGAAASEQPL